jgi:hypothetical protein
MPKATKKTNTAEKIYAEAQLLKKARETSDKANIKETHALLYEIERPANAPLVKRILEG